MRTRHSKEAFATLREHIGESSSDDGPPVDRLRRVLRARISILDHRPDLGADYIALADVAWRG